MAAGAAGLWKTLYEEKEQKMVDWCRYCQIGCFIGTSVCIYEAQDLFVSIDITHDTHDSLCCLRGLDFLRLPQIGDGHSGSF